MVLGNPSLAYTFGSVKTRTTDSATIVSEEVTTTELTVPESGEINYGQWKFKISPVGELIISTGGVNSMLLAVDGHVHFFGDISVSGQVFSEVG